MRPSPIRPSNASGAKSGSIGVSAVAWIGPYLLLKQEECLTHRVPDRSRRPGLWASSKSTRVENSCTGPPSMIAPPWTGCTGPSPAAPHHVFESTGPSRSRTGPFTDTTAPPTSCTPSRPPSSLHCSAATGLFATGTGPAIDTTTPPPCCAPPSTGTPLSSTTPPAHLRPARLHPLIPPAFRLAARLPRPEPRWIAERHRPSPASTPPFIESTGPSPTSTGYSIDITPLRPSARLPRRSPRLIVHRHRPISHHPRSLD